MEHERLLIGSIIAIPIGYVLLGIIPAILYSLAGIQYGQYGGSNYLPWMVGQVISFAGLITLIFGIVGLILSFVLEFLSG